MAESAELALIGRSVSQLLKDVRLLRDEQAQFATRHSFDALHTHWLASTVAIEGRLDGLGAGLDGLEAGQARIEALLMQMTGGRP
jgi:hypothetical protein